MPPLDYCCPCQAFTFRPYFVQRAAAAHPLTGRKSCDHITPPLASLLRLAVRPLYNLSFQLYQWQKAPEASHTRWLLLIVPGLRFSRRSDTAEVAPNSRTDCGADFQSQSKRISWLSLFMHKLVEPSWGCFWRFCRSKICFDLTNCGCPSTLVEYSRFTSR